MDTSRVKSITIGAEKAGQRVDNFLFSAIKGVPKTRIYRALRKGEVRVNKKRVKAEYRLQEDDILRIPPFRVGESKEPMRVGPRILTLLKESILYEDNDLLIVNKPAGIAVHGGTGSNFGVIEALRQLYPQAKLLELAHRLDKGTSGCLVIAKKSSVLKELHHLFRDHLVEKRYWALVKGTWQGKAQVVTAPLRKSELGKGERIVRVDKQGRSALTHIRPLRKFNEAALVEASPKSGRTHQIRVHCAEIGHPIACDDKYGDADFNRQMRQKGLHRMFLHAQSLAFELSAGKKIKVEAPLPKELDHIISSLGMPS